MGVKNKLWPADQDSVYWWLEEEDGEIQLCACDPEGNAEIVLFIDGDGVCNLEPRCTTPGLELDSGGHVEVAWMGTSRGRRDG